MSLFSRKCPNCRHKLHDGGMPKEPEATPTQCRECGFKGCVACCRTTHSDFQCPKCESFSYRYY